MAEDSAGVAVSTDEDGSLVVQVQGEHQELLNTITLDGVSIEIPQGQDGDGDGEPTMKRLKVDADASIKQILFNINKAICLRLDGIENKLEVVNMRTKYLEEKVESMHQQIKQNPGIVIQDTSSRKSAAPTRRSGAVIVGLPQIQVKSESDINDGSPIAQIDTNVQNLGPNVTLITLNSEDDHPNGSWLGDDTNPEMRVRAPVSPSDMLHIQSNFRTPEKMALTLLDYLFDRDTQASSNISGMGKHGKKQLDPLYIYGIRCHLIHKFGISESDWHRIKQNIDSKCRTAFRRRMRGMPLMVKAFRGKAPPQYTLTDSPGDPHDMGSQSDDSLQHDPEATLHIHQGAQDVEMVSEHGELTQGEVQILHATPEQLAQLQQTHQIQILHGDQVIHHMQQDVQEGVHMAVSLAGQPEAIQVVPVTSDTGEMQIQIQNVHARGGEGVLSVADVSGEGVEDSG
ncbi:protein BANP-like isoform X1 [Lineus longissimus]|uniref:protein BANP-like isoform X1 n=1 Tax=Lineus longissimus TaxID=88925 RepID=UPI002B4D5058